MDDYKAFQYTSHLVRFVGYLRQKDEIGNLLRIQMDQHQLIIGSGTDFLELLSITYPHGESLEYSSYGRRTHIIKSLSRYRGAGTNTYHEHTTFFDHHPKLLLKINNIRLYLKLSRLSDIVQEDGQWMHEWAFYGPPSNFTLKWFTCRKSL